MMSEIMQQAKLSKKYMNHQVRKTTAIAMKRSGYSLQEIANVTKHKNLDCLKHYLAVPTHEEKEEYTKVLHNYGKDKRIQPLRPAIRNKQEDSEPKEKIPKQTAAAPKSAIMTNFNENINPDQCLVPMYPDDTDSNTSTEATPKRQNNLQNVVNNQLCHASHLFQNASFNNCQFSFNFPN